MLSVILDLDPMADTDVQSTSVSLGTPVPVIVKIRNDSDKPIRFNSIDVQLLFNDQDDVLFINPEICPIAGDLAGNSDATRCVVSHEPVQPGSPSDPDGPFSSGSILALSPDIEGPRGPYRGATGRAGLLEPEGEFVLQPGEMRVAAGGKAQTGLATTTAGTTHIVGIARVFDGSKVIPTVSELSEVTVIEQ